MRRYHITDAEGEQYLIEEPDVQDDEIIEEPAAEAVEELTADEIKALKSLIERIPEIISLLDAEKVEPDVVAEDADEDEDEEIVVDTDEDEEDEDEKVHDSKRSFGSMQKNNKAVIDDSLTDDVSSAWAKRFGGTK